MSLGFVIGESKPTFVTAITSRALSVGEYIKIGSDEGEILGLVEKSSVTSAAFADVRNFDEAAESTEIAELNKRDKTFTALIGILGFLENLRRGQSIIPAIPPIPGTEITQPSKQDLEEIFSPKNNGWVKIGNLLRNKTIDAKVNLDKIVSRHLGILAMTGMGKSNLVSLVTKQISKLKGTVIIFDYHNDYTTLNIPRINVVDAKINPRLLDADQLSEVLEIREGADIQQRILRKAFTPEVKESANFWEALDQQVQYIGSDPERKEERHSADRVQDKIDDARNRFADILDPDMVYPVGLIKEGRLNILNVSEFSDKQANVALGYYLQELLNDRKAASNAKSAKSKSKRSYMFNSPIFVIIEEAHVFIPKGEDARAKYWATKIAREGRKFGLGLCVVSQRPRNIEHSILSQMGSLAVMKIVQEDDQHQIASASESISRDFIAQLTSLNVGDAVLVGQWVNLPAIIHIDEMKGKMIGSDQNAVDQWTIAKKFENENKGQIQGTVQKDLLLD